MEDVYLIPIVLMDEYIVEYLEKLVALFSSYSRDSRAVLLINDCDEDTMIFLERLSTLYTQSMVHEFRDLVEICVLIAKICRHTRIIHDLSSKELSEREYDNYVALMTRIHSDLRRLRDKGCVVGLDPEKIIDCKIKASSNVMLESVSAISKLIGIHGQIEVMYARELDDTCSKPFLQVIFDAWRKSLEKHRDSRVSVVAPRILAKPMQMLIPSDTIIYV